MIGQTLSLSLMFFLISEPTAQQKGRSNQRDDCAVLTAGR